MVLCQVDISGALAEQNIEAAPGSFGEQSNMKYEYTMRYKGRLKTEKEYGDIIISANNNGQTLHLRDVADVKLGGLMYSVSMLNNEKPAVIGMVQQIAGSNATQIAKDVKAALAEAQKTMPPGMKVVIEEDVTDFLFASMEEVIFTLFLTFGISVPCSLCLLARYPFYIDTDDCRTSGVDWFFLLPMDVRFLYQLADAFCPLAGDCNCGGRRHCRGRSRSCEARFRI